ncbi:MAG: sigma-70 family RNA polymerase sigma factor [Chitinophagaceae bacterium]|nr:sigma-70 family RNA polymerase sigma factor [Chitinophagaceae bacterium]
MNDYRDDIDWWNAFKNGDREAFDNLFRRYYPVLTQFGSKICTDREMLEDAIQDLFIEFWQSRSTTPVQSVKAYFFKALKYKLFRQIRLQNKQTQRLSSPDQVPFTLPHEHFIVRGEEDAQRTRQIREAIDSLPARQKEIIYLRIYQGLGYEEISEVMNINYQVARNLFYQSVKSLRLQFSVK